MVDLNCEGSRDCLEGRLRGGGGTPTHFQDMTGPGRARVAPGPGGPWSALNFAQYQLSQVTNFWHQGRPAVFRLESRSDGQAQLSLTFQLPYPSEIIPPPPPSFPTPSPPNHPAPPTKRPSKKPSQASAPAHLPSPHLQALALVWRASGRHILLGLLPPLPGPCLSPERCPTQPPQPEFHPFLTPKGFPLQPPHPEPHP